MKKKAFVIAGVIILILTAIYYLGFITPRIQSDIQSRTEAALSEAELSSITPETNGRNVTLLGKVTDMSVAEKALGIAENVTGVRSVINQIEVLSSETTPENDSLTPDGTSEMDTNQIAESKSSLSPVSENSEGTDTKELIKNPSLLAENKNEEEKTDLNESKKEIDSRTENAAVKNLKKNEAEISPQKQAASETEGLFNPYLSLIRKEEQLILKGIVPNEKTKQSILASLKRAGDKEIKDDTTIVSNTSIQWSNIIDLFSINFINDFKNFDIKFSESVLNIEGEVYSEKTKHDLIRIMKAYLPNDINLSHEILSAELSRDMKLCQDQFNDLFKRESVLFSTASVKIQDNSTVLLKNVVKIINECGFEKLKVIGHTDNQGDALANLSLSKKRAEATADFLIGLGLKKNRLSTAGYGEYCPVTGNQTVQDRLKNRRIEIVILQ